MLTGILLGLGACFFFSSFGKGEYKIGKMLGGLFMMIVAVAGFYLDFKVAQIEHRKAYEAQNVTIQK